MRKNFSLILCAFMLVLAAGCAGGGDSNSPKAIQKGDYEKVPGAATQAPKDGESGQ